MQRFVSDGMRDAMWISLRRISCRMVAVLLFNWYNIRITYLFAVAANEDHIIVCFHKKQEIAIRKRFYYAGLHLQSDAIQLVLLGYLKDHFIVSFK